MIAARVDGELQGPRLRARGRRRRSRASRSTSRTGATILRHSTAHVLAQAVQELFPEAKLGIGPPIENGFYYDFDVPEPFKPEDLEAIETRMRKIVKESQRFSRRPVSDDEARDGARRRAVQARADRAQGGSTGSTAERRRRGRERRGRVPAS